MRVVVFGCAFYVVKQSLVLRNYTVGLFMSIVWYFAKIAVIEIFFLRLQLTEILFRYVQQFPVEQNLLFTYEL